MKISNEEVSRLLSMTPSGQGSYRSATSLLSAPQSESSQFNEAVSVEVSSAAQEVQQVKNMLKQLPDIRHDRVSTLKAQIESGNYKVSGEDIADLIIRRILADSVAL